MKLNDIVFLVDKNNRVYENKKVIESKYVVKGTIERETNQSFFIKYKGNEYRYSKKDKAIVSGKSSELYGLSIAKALGSLNKKTIKNKIENYTLIKCDDGIQRKLEHKYLDDDFCEEALDWAIDNSVIPESARTTSFFVSMAVKQYIKENSIDPVYE